MIKLVIYENEFNQSYCEAHPDCKVTIYNTANDLLVFKKEYKPEYSRDYHTPPEVFLVNIYKIKCKRYAGSERFIHGETNLQYCA